MTRTFRMLAFAVGASLAPVAALAQHDAAVVHAGDLAISDVTLAATTPAAPAAAVYLTIANAGATPDRLVSVETTAARRVEIHDTVITDGVARMTALPDGVEVPAGGEATLAPRGRHVMLMGLTAPLADGARVPLTLVFETAGRVEIEAPTHVGAPAQGTGHGG